jgi:hypothetical protein
MVILSLVTSLPLVVVAQGEEAAPTSFTGLALWGDCDEDGGWTRYVNGVDISRDYACPGGWMRTTDPRFSGAYDRVANTDVYPNAKGDTGDGSLMVTTVTRRVENDDGTWVATPSVEAWLTPEDTDLLGVLAFPTQTLVFIGEGGYEGLTAVVWTGDFDLALGFSGVIFVGEPPPVPVVAG